MKKVKKSCFLIILIICISLLLPAIYNNKNFTSLLKEDLNKIHISAEQSYTKQWIKNHNFTSQQDWYATEQGDFSDVSATITGGEAHYDIIGNESIFSLEAFKTNKSKWQVMLNPEFPAYPEWDGADQYDIDDGGFWTRHKWSEGPRQTPSVNWIQNVSIDVNISDYVITSAEINAIFNASVNENVDVDPSKYGDIVSARPDGNPSNPQGAVYDYVHFYIKIASPDWLDNPAENPPYTIAYNRTYKLGLNKTSTGELILEINDTFMETVGEEFLIFYLESVLSQNYKDFIIIVGIDIFCEDNCYSDRDYFDDLRIKTFSLNFTCEKKMDQSTFVSWNQDGEKPNDISNNTVIVNEALLDFEYKINETWPIVSPNSEIRIYINKIMHSETIKLSSATNSSQKAKPEGFDVTRLIDEDKNINISIQVYLADEFVLNRSIRISIDNAYLNISYTETFPDISTNLQLFLNGVDKTLDPIISLPLDENLNITIKYTENQTGTHITNASVQLEGKVSATLNESIALQHYSTIVNTSQLGIGVKILTITAQKDIYDTQQIQFFVEVTERDTELNLFVNGIQKYGGDKIQVDVNATINITVQYRDFVTKNHLSNASINLIGIGKLNESNNQYNITIYAKDLGQGFTVMSIIAQLVNYQSQSIEFYIEVIERETELRLFLNGIERYDGDTIQFEIDEDINITVYYRDNHTKEHISNASVILVGRGILNETFTQYNITINAGDLSQGITVLSIFAQLVNYQPQSIQFYIEIVERSTGLQLFLNSEDKTTDPVYELTIGQSLNITAKYFDNQTGMHIDTATLQLIGEDLSLNFTRDDLLGQHYIYLNTTELGIGVKLFSIVAKATNYQINTIDPRITVKRINAQIVTESGESQIEIEVGNDVLLRIVLNNTVFGGFIKNATVTYTWAFGQGELLDVNNTGIYEATLRNIQAGPDEITIYKITINAFAGDNYDFEAYEITLVINRPITEPGPDLSWLIYTLIGAIVGLVIIFGVYQKYYKFPPLVRKIRKIKKKIKKNRKIKPISLQTREKLVEKNYQAKIHELEIIPHPPEKILKSDIDIINKSD